jgi:ribosome recycling factor
VSLELFESCRWGAKEVRNENGEDIKKDKAKKSEDEQTKREEAMSYGYRTKSKG